MKKSGRDSTPQPRQTAAWLVNRVADHGESLSSLLGPALSRYHDSRQRALVQELAFGTLRWFHRLDGLLARLMDRPLKSRDRDLRALLLVGLYQLLILEIPPHAAVAETVEAARRLGKRWAAGLVNAVLRNAQRRQGELLESVAESETTHWSHPEWWIRQLQQDWPDQWERILDANNARPPMVLRVNERRVSRDRYLEQLGKAGLDASALECCPQAIRLAKPAAVDVLPGFDDGLVSVQDAAAQLAAALLDPAPGQRVLDACAAPGGKTGHILELQPQLAGLVAIDADSRRLQKVAGNLDRLQLKAELVAADAAVTDSWWDGTPFDRILLDAPCSASGVVRRHPDIKLLRREDDLAALSRQQQRLLEALWPLLAPGGILLYATCSVFRCENSDGIQAFLKKHGDAGELPIHASWGVALPVGRQVLPGEQTMDGFYFARITKEPVTSS